MEFLLKGRASWPTQMIVWFFAAYCAFVMVGSGFGKVMAPEAFGSYPIWLMWIVGLIEVVGPLMMFVPRTSFYGAAPVAVVMAVASYHAMSFMEVTTFLGYMQMPPTIAAILALIVAIVMRPDCLRKKAPIIKVSV
ncbi:MAG: hypothetical protein P1V18_01785 [Candidatus Gracilibacteria bacterium]|nr:hypothetical protein [Candidatus Gracilibacteria bacterium]